MPNPENIAGHRNSFSTSVKCGNWMEDQCGVRLAHALPSHLNSSKMETTQYHDTFPSRSYAAPKVAFAPRPIDTLDGHLVMAHGTNIIDRTIKGDHYLSINRGTMQAIKPQTLLDVHEVTKVPLRTDLIRQKAAMRAAGYEPWDPTVMAMKNNLPSISTTVSRVETGQVELGRATFHPFTSVTGTTLGAAASLRDIQPASARSSFARSGAFSSTFKVAPRA